LAAVRSGRSSAGTGGGESLAAPPATATVMGAGEREILGSLWTLLLDGSGSGFGKLGLVERGICEEDAEGI